MSREFHVLMAMLHEMVRRLLCSTVELEVDPERADEPMNTVTCSVPCILLIEK